MVDRIRIKRIIDVDADVVSDISARNLTEWETKWLPIIENPNIEKYGFDWFDIMSKFEGDRNCLKYSLMYDDETQAMMVLSLNKKPMNENRHPENGCELVYIEYVEVAPWNQNFYKSKRKFLGLGSEMIALASKISYEKGLDGRLGLHSLPESEGFYRFSKMKDLGEDGSGLRYFEFDPKYLNLNNPND